MGLYFGANNHHLATAQTIKDAHSDQNVSRVSKLKRLTPANRRYYFFSASK